MKNIKKIRIIILSLAFLLAFGLYLERSDWFNLSKQAVNHKVVPTELLNYGPMGKVLKQLGLIMAIPNDNTLYQESQEDSINLDTIIFQKKRKIGKYLYTVTPKSWTEMPSSRIIKPEDLKKGWSVISIVIDEEDLYDEKKGIIPNYGGRGNEWERLSYFSYYENKELKFASAAGLRLHGGYSRRFGRNFRVYFRKEYGINQFPPGILYNSKNKPIKRLIIHFDFPQSKPFTSCLAFDISREIGCEVPDAKPVIFYLNGESKKNYYMTVHLGRKQWSYLLGHDHFLFYQYRGNPDTKTLRVFKELENWANNHKTPMTLKEAAKRVNIENLTRNLISYAFCGTEDWKQGAAILNMKSPEPKWYWVNWDMDRSFWHQSRPKEGEKRIPHWKKPVFELILNPLNKNVRSVLCKRLLEESPEYKNYFVRSFTDILNHRLNASYLNSRVNYYRKLAIIFWKRNRKSIKEMVQFVKNRPSYVREKLQERFDLGKIFLCQVKGPDKIKYKIDSYPEKTGYKGYYFEGMDINITIENSKGKKFSHWLVNGKKAGGGDLSYKIKSNTIIEPVF